MHDRYIRRIIPDEIPDFADDVDPEVWAEIKSLHSTLKLKDQQNQRRKKDLFEKHGIMLNEQNDVVIRLNLLTDMFIGTLSPERLRYEIKWAEIVAASLEDGYAEYQEMKRQQAGAKTLHIPGRGNHTVLPEKEEPGGS